MPGVAEVNSKKQAVYAEHARKAVNEKFDDSAIEDLSSQYPKFKWDELKLGKVLGKGGFGTVSECVAFDASVDESSRSNGSSNSKSSKSKRNTMKKTSSQSGEIRSMSYRSITKSINDLDEDSDDSVVSIGAAESRRFIAEHCKRNNCDARYAVKVLSPEVVRDPSKYIQGTIDMAIETRFLSFIEHPNIIKMRALPKSDPYEGSYFIVMDRLYDTLEKRIRKWLNRSNRNSGLAGKLIDRKGEKKTDLLEERLVAAFDLASAIEYLHGKNIIYRDIKPENIGFDVRGDIKLFDFGLAIELREKQRNPDGTYNLTEMTGSMRYMAPENANGKPYNATCDSYSFAILFWQMLALKTPFEMYTPMTLRQKVYNGPHKRPKIEKSWGNPIKLCLTRSWAEDLHSRNTMAQIGTILRKECVRVRDGDETGLEHNRRRSTFVFRPSQASSSSPSSPKKVVEVTEMASSKIEARVEETKTGLIEF